MGKFHPLIVHLPIGILFLNIVFVILAKTKRYESLSVAIPITLLLGVMSSLLACVTGWFLAEKGDYDPNILSYHKWLGISVAVFSVGLYVFNKRDNLILWVILIVGLTLTGHFGGTLTHGENYFSFGSKENTPPSVGAKQEVHKLPVDIQDAEVYADLVVPILKKNCYSCHNNSKKKGKLQMDDETTFLAGGEHGAIVVAGQAAQSEMIKRILLDLDNKQHMPPKGKPQPTAQDITLLKWWIDKGLFFNKKVKEIEQNEEVRTALTRMSQPQTEKKNPYIPDARAEKVDDKRLEDIRKKGILIFPVEPQSAYLQANFVSVPNAGNKEVALLEPYAKQLIWLKLGGTKLTDSAMHSLAKLTSLTRLSVENTRITDSGLALLKTLTNLKYLNIVGTDITTGGLLTTVSQLPKLEQIYIFKTRIQPDVLAELKQKMPQTIFDTGGYSVPTWASDTTVFKKMK